MNELDPKYTLPARKTISNNLIPAAYEEDRANLKEMLKKTDFVSLTTDLWTNAKSESYNAVTCHFWRPNVKKLETKILECKKVCLNSKFMAEKLVNVFS